MKPTVVFIERLSALFGAPQTADVEATFNEYTNALSGQTAATLQRAADIIAKTHRHRAWPTVAECLDAVTQARKVPNSAAMGLERIDDFDGWWAERMARIRTAASEREIITELRIIEPYHTPRWIAGHRMPDAIAAANQRRLEWQGQRTADTTRRMMGESA